MNSQPVPVTLQPWPANPLRNVFTPDIVAAWKRVAPAPEELVRRWKVLEADGSYLPGSSIASHARGVRAQKAALECYLTAAFACGLFDGIKGKELRGRLTSKLPHDFRSGVSECLAAWFLAGKYKLPMNPAAPGRGVKNLEMVVFWKGQSVGVEVKAPSREGSLDGVGWGDGSDKVEEAVNKANKQFDDKGPNLLVLVPDLPLKLCHHRASLLHALFGRSKITFPVSLKTGARSGPINVKFFPEGKLLKKQKADGSPGYRRISAVLCIEEFTIEKYTSTFFADERWSVIPPWWKEGRELHDSPDNLMIVQHNAVVLHNPHAYHALDQKVFEGIPQCVPVGTTMAWTDGHDASV